MEPRIISRSEAHRLGYTDDEIWRACRDGRLTRLARGRYGQGQFSEVDKHLARAVLALSNLPQRTALSHTTAALMHRLPVDGSDLSTVHVTRAGTTGRHSAKTLTHSAALSPEHTTFVEGVRVTSLSRTVVDCARLLAFDDGVALADAALRRGGVSRKQLESLLEEGRHREGIPRARRVVAAATDRSESPGETRSRLFFARCGLPEPALQANVWSADDQWLARSDFLWDDYGVIGEFDGLVKYTDDAPEVVVAEKLREDRLRDVGWVVVRWIWEELMSPDALHRKIERALGRGTRSPSRFSIDLLPKPPALSGRVLSFSV